MQEENLHVHALRVGALPILNRIIERMGLADYLRHSMLIFSAGDDSVLFPT